MKKPTTNYKTIEISLIVSITPPTAFAPSEARGQTENKSKP